MYVRVISKESSIKQNDRKSIVEHVNLIKSTEGLNQKEIII